MSENMTLPWHIALEDAPALKSESYPPETSLLEHYCKLDIHKNPCEELQTGIMCDIGINNRAPSNVQRLICSGMTIARLNMRDLEPNACTQLIQSIRQAVYNYSAELQYVYPLAIIVDVRGPDIVTGDLKSGPRTTVELIQSNTIRLTTDASWRESGTAECLFVAYDHLTDLTTGDNIFIDSLTQEKVKLVVSKVGDDSVECLIAVGGTIGAKMTVRISSGPVTNFVSQKDSRESLVCGEPTPEQLFEHMEGQISWAIGSDVDAILVSNTQTRNDIRQVRQLVLEKGKHLLLFACVDTSLGLDNIDEIIDEADGIFLDRSILATDLAIEKIFIAQKIILAKCNNAGKPCICKAVINEQIPTLCVTDLANLILDGADVLSLEFHYDSPLKKFAPCYDALRMAEHCVAAASVIGRHAERIVWQPRTYGNVNLMQSPLKEPTQAICVTAVELAQRSNASVIICLTNSGRTAKIISHARPSCPIVAVTRMCHSARQLRFWQGVRSVHYFDTPKDNWRSEVDARVHAGLNYCKAKCILCGGDAFVTVTGSRRGVGYCDSVRLLYASARDTISVE